MSLSRRRNKENAMMISPVASNNTISPKLTKAHPLLSSGVPNHSKKRRHRSPKANEKPALISASIPFPPTHISRTPSELQLADDKRRADYEDIRMFSRLVVGMQSQCIRVGYVHPKTKKSMQDIVQTKQANAEELDVCKLHSHAEEDDDWELSFNNDYDDEYAASSSSVGIPQPCQPGTTSSNKATSVVKTPSNVSMVSNPPDLTSEDQEKDEEDEEDECLFSLEL